MEKRVMRSICEIGGKLPILHSSMEAVCVCCEHFDSLNLGRNPALTLAVEASKMAPILRCRRLNRTKTAQTEPPVNRHCTN